MRPLPALLVAALLLATPLLLPEPVAALPGRLDQVHALTRRWLCGSASPLTAWRTPRGLPPLQCELRTSPPLTDAGEHTARAEALARLGAVAAAAHGAAVDQAAAALPLLVRVGEHGVAFELPAPAGEPVRASALWTRRLALLPFAAVVAVVALCGSRCGASPAARRLLALGGAVLGIAALLLPSADVWLEAALPAPFAWPLAVAAAVAAAAVAACGSPIVAIAAMLPLAVLPQTWQAPLGTTLADAAATAVGAFAGALVARRFSAGRRALPLPPGAAGPPAAPPAGPAPAPGG